MSSEHVLIIGGGVIGAACAWRLAEAGAQVTLIDAGDGGVAASGGSLAWLNASSASDVAYAALRIASMRRWHAFARETDCPVHITGALVAETGAEDCARHAAWLTGQSWEARVIDATEITMLEPALRDTPTAAIHLPGEGYADPRWITAWFADRARGAGAEIVTGEVSALEVAAGSLTSVRMGGERLLADRVLVAAGIESGPLLAALGIRLPMKNLPGLLIRTTPGGRCVNGFVATPEVHFWQAADGSILAGSDYSGDLRGETPEESAAFILEELKALLPMLGDIRIASTSLRLRPMPADGFPAVGTIEGIEGLYLAVMHSGMTLAPIVAETAAREILGGTAEPLLAPYRPGRTALRKPEPV